MVLSVVLSVVLPVVLPVVPPVMPLESVGAAVFAAASFAVIRVSGGAAVVLQVGMSEASVF